MSPQLSPLAAALLAQLPADGSAIGYQTIRDRLACDDAAYVAARDELAAVGLVEKGKGRRGSIRRALAANPKAELFEASEVESKGPELARAQRQAGALAATSTKKDSKGTPITEHRYSEDKRKNLPPAGGDAITQVAEEAKITFAYDPHRPPVLRFNEGIVRVRVLLEESKRRLLTPAEADELAALIEAPQPWLEWTGKREQQDFTVDPVALHIHERVSAQAILKAVRREDIQRDMFADAAQSPKEARAYYQYDVDWANRLILGDSLQVMTSLARREGLAGQVQMIYFDPPYGIKFSSNWQNEVGKRDVKDKDEDLTREPEMIKAYRDTWTLGVHSYLAYLKQRFVLARELLTDSGSIFVQISDENLHRVRAVMDEVFGSENFCRIISVQKKGGEVGQILGSTCDYLVWYAKQREALRYFQLYKVREPGSASFDRYSDIDPLLNVSPGEEERRLYKESVIFSEGESKEGNTPFEFQGRQYLPRQGAHWKTTDDGLGRLAMSDRIISSGRMINYKRFLYDFSVVPVSDRWESVLIGTEKRYVVQTPTKVIERCMLMTTNPGDLVLDPTCGSGTTAYVAEEWGRRWITVDSSRVAAAIARQRLLTASFDTYKTRDPQAGVDPNQPLNPRHGFHYKTVPHITLKSIAQNKGLDPIFAKHDPILAGCLFALNTALAGVKDALRQQLVGKLIKKLREDGARSVTDADQRRWLLPGTDAPLIQQQKGGPTATQARDLRAAIPGSTNPPSKIQTPKWEEWEVPFDTDPDWPQPLQTALTAYRAAWRAKMDEVNACISANAEQEELVDQPATMPGVVRVAGPFTVESVRPPESSLKGEAEGESLIGGEPGELDTFEATVAPERDVKNAASHIERMLGLLRHDGITFLGNKHVTFTQGRLDAIESSFLHAEGEFAAEDGKPHRVAVVIGPEFGSVPSFQVEQAMRAAHRRGYDDLVFAGFSFDATAQETVQAYNDEPRAEVRIHLAQIRPDVTMGDLLKKSAATAQIFTVFGQPRTRVDAKGSELIVHMEGVDIYDPVKNAIDATSAAKVAAWFLDTDYDGKVFCICQAFFPDKTAWEKLARALKSTLAEGAFEALSSTTSLPFKPGAYQTIAVKVIDPRGNEVMRVHRLDRKYAQGVEG